MIERDSFDNSGFDSFVGSGFDSFDQPGLGVAIIMNWIDEATPVYNPDGNDQWDADLEDLEAALEGTIERAFGLYVPWPPGAIWYDCAAGTTRSGSDVPEFDDEAGVNPNRPCARTMPGFIDQMREVGRPPPLSRFQNDFQHLRAALGARLGRDQAVTPSTLIIDIDGSGSMRRHTIEPGIDLFKEWVAREFPSVRVIERVYPNERWLWQTAESIRLATETIANDQ